MGTKLLDEIESLKKRIIKLENKIPDTNLFHHSIIKRSFSVFGHYGIAIILITIPFIVYFIILINKINYTY